MDAFGAFILATIGTKAMKIATAKRIWCHANLALAHQPIESKSLTVTFPNICFLNFYFRLPWSFQTRYKPILPIISLGCCISLYSYQHICWHDLSNSALPVGWPFIIVDHFPQAQISHTVPCWQFQNSNFKHATLNNYFLLSLLTAILGTDTV